MPAMSALQVNSFAYTSSIANVAAVTMDGGFFQRWAEMRRIFFTLCASGGPPAYNLRQASFLWQKKGPSSFDNASLMSTMQCLEHFNAWP